MMLLCGGVGLLFYFLSFLFKKSSDGNSKELEDLFNQTMIDAECSKYNKSKSYTPYNHQNKNGTAGGGIDYGLKRKEYRGKNKNSPKKNSMTTVTVHDHDCGSVNYDEMDVLTGKEGSFNLSDSEAPYYEPLQKSKISITRKDLLKSFIMNEVLQRYDINRIYSRIPSSKSDG